jgi:rod shape determining protein RodA
MKLIPANQQYIDWILYLTVIFAVVLGIVVIYSLAFLQGQKSLFWGQIIYASIGFAAMLAISFLDYRLLKNISIPLYAIGLILLILVLFFGKSTFGATRWIELRFFQLQPSEIMKFILIIFMASFLSQNDELRLKHFIYLFAELGIPIFLVILQPDVGTALVFIFIALMMLISHGLKRNQIIGLLIFIGISIPITWKYILRGYQKARIFNFINPQNDPFHQGYNVLQSIIATGSGMMFGRGLGKGIQSQLNFLPVPYTDFIFAALAEQLGFIGIIVLIALFTLIFWRILKIAKSASDQFGFYLCIGFFSMILFQFLINIGMNIGLAPVTGIPLPLISYGGTSIIITLLGIGVIQSVFIRHKKMFFD